MPSSFVCDCCGKLQRVGKRFPVTEANIGAVKARMEATGRAELAARVKVDMRLCTVQRRPSARTSMEAGKCRRA